MICNLQNNNDLCVFIAFLGYSKIKPITEGLKHDYKAKVKLRKNF